MTAEDDSRQLELLLKGDDPLGVIGSPSSTAQLTMDIVKTAVERNLVGELAMFQFTQDDTPHYALGQITEVQLRNVWHEDHTMRSLIRQRGAVDAVSERQDTHTGQMVTSAVFCDSTGGSQRYEPSALGTVPATGTTIHRVTDPILQDLLSSYREQLFYLGNVYGSEPRLPMWFKHFDRGPDGAGEAYHMGIFGKTGSGKSVLAKMLLLGYSRYPKMSLLVLDPQGEFAKDVREGAISGPDFSLPFGDLAKTNFDKDAEVLSVQDMVMDRWELFQEVLYESRFFAELTVPKGDNRLEGCIVLADRLKKRQGINLHSLHTRESFDAAWNLLGEDSVQQRIYKSAQPRERLKEAHQDASADEFFRAHWEPVTKLFSRRSGAKLIESVLNALFDPQNQQKRLLVIDLSGENIQGLFWNEKIQSMMIRRLLQGIRGTAERSYREGQSLNALVVIDEAHRFAPRGRIDKDAEASEVRKELVDAARTTRKYGLGWLFISQTLSSIHTEILQQLRIMFFGFGLGLGQEFQSLRELVGSSGSALDLYQRFLDPHSAFDIDSRRYSFMTIGPVSPLSFSGTPLFLNVFNTLDSFMKANDLTDRDPSRLV